jgi:hypothetical protein
MPETSQFVHESAEPSGPTELQPVALPTAVDGIDILNDEVIIEVPPARPSGALRVRLVCTGRSTPVPADDPWGE